MVLADDEAIELVALRGLHKEALPAGGSQDFEAELLRGAEEVKVKPPASVGNKWERFNLADEYPLKAGSVVKERFEH